MTPEALKTAVSNNIPLDNPTPTEQCLWHAGTGAWDAAHDMCNGEVTEPASSWIHAHLHRQEGDLGNANYWYYQANKSMPDSSVSIEQEWEQLVDALV